MVSTFTGEPTREQRAWLGVLHAGPPAIVGGYTALEFAGLKNWHRDNLTILVDDEEHLEPLDGIDWFRTRRPLDLWHSQRHELPVARVEPAALREQLERMKPLRRAPRIRVLLTDFEGGAQSVAEVDVKRMCLDYGLPLPNRQKRRKDRTGKWRYTDCEWDLPDGQVLVLEVDGAFHMEVEHWEDDIQRHRALTTPGRLIVRGTAREVRDEPFRLAADLRALGLGALCA